MPNTKSQIPEVKTLVIDKFNGRMSRFRDGNINSGMTNFFTSWGYNTFDFSGTLSFLQSPISIAGSVITDCVMAGKIRMESGIAFMYAIGHTGRLYKIQINDIASKNPDYDTPVLLATLANGQTFHYGASLDFYQGVSEKIWIGHDTGATKINFDASGETNFIGGSWVSNVPRQQAQFVGKLYFTNGSNITEFDATEAITTYTKLSPGFPSNSQARDMDLSSDGRYLIITVARNAIGDMVGTAPDTNQIASMPSYLFYWNGTDVAPTSVNSFPAFTINTYKTFYSYEYLFGFQVGGAMLGSPKEVLKILVFDTPPLPNAVDSSGNLLSWAAPIWDAGVLKMAIYLFGKVDDETDGGIYRQLLLSSSLSGGNIMKVPFYTAVSCAELGPSTGGYAAPFNFFGTGKTYFSTVEYNGSTTSYGFYSFKNASDFLTAYGAGIYETQHQVFSEKILVKEVRVYFEPVTADGIVSFQTDLIGLDGSVISGGTKVFSPTTTSGDRLKYNPSHSPTSALGLRITNAGASTPYIHKVEIDYTSAGN